MSATDRPPAEKPPVPPTGEIKPGTAIFTPEHDDRPRPRYFAPGSRRSCRRPRWVLLLPFNWRRRRSNVDELTVYSAHPGFYLWVLILAGFVLAPVVRSHPNLGEAAGWIYIAIAFYFIVTVLYDLSTPQVSAVAGHLSR